MANIGRDFRITSTVEMIIEDGIFQCYFKDIDLLDIDTAKSSNEERLVLFNGRELPCFFDISKVKNTTKEARDFIANEGNALVLATAILVTSPVLKMMANFFVSVNKPQNPTKVFTDKESAIQWLKQFRKINS
ncbi:MAG: hypothetical protein ACFCUU_01285 [Cyclobacteriaceae bacterium]